MRHPKRLLGVGIATTAIFVASVSPAFGAASENASCVGQILSTANQSPGPSPIGPTFSEYNRTRKELGLPSLGTVVSEAAHRDRNAC